jgi:release factor glutamine methyltransferase
VPTILELKLSLRKQLQEKLKLGLEEAETEASVILQFCLKQTSTWLQLNSGLQVAAGQEQVAKKLITERLKHVPLQHLTGEAYFFGLKFKVNKHVLIPRPETETLVELALKWLSTKKEPQILEIGTGSGCISVALAHFLKNKNPTVWATDISDEALTIAEENAQQNLLNEFITFEHTDLVNKELMHHQYDLVISNPPYISPEEFFGLEPEVQREPYKALVGDSSNKDGLLYYKRIAYLELKSNCLLLEIDHGRAEEIKNIFLESSFKQVNLLPDLNGMNRFLKCF